MEKAQYFRNYLMQQIPSFDQQNLKMRFFPVQATQMILSSWLKANPVGALKHRSAIERILCCCMSITKRLPLLFAETFSPNAPQSVKKIFPVLLDRINECGPNNEVPQYSFTSSVYEESAAPRDIIDCLRRSVKQKQFLAWSNTTERSCPLILANSLSCPSKYLMISPLNEQKIKAYSVSNGENSGELTSRIFSELVKEKNISYNNSNQN